MHKRATSNSPDPPSMLCVLPIHHSPPPTSSRVRASFMVHGLPSWLPTCVAGWGLFDGPGLASCPAQALCPHFFPCFFPWLLLPLSSTAGRASMQVGVSSPVGSLRQAESGTSLLVRDQLPRCRATRASLVSTCASSSGSLRLWCGTSPLDDPPPQHTHSTHSLTHTSLRRPAPHASRTARSLRLCMALPNARAGLAQQLATPLHSTQHHNEPLPLKEMRREVGVFLLLCHVMVDRELRGVGRVDRELPWCRSGR